MTSETRATPIFRVRELSFRHPGGIPALEAVSFEILPGESVAVLGANGCGKSTLLRLLDGLAQPGAGAIQAFGRELSERSLEDPVYAREFRRRVGLLFQDPDVQLFSATVRDEVAFGPLQLGLEPEVVTARVADVLALLGIERLAGRPPHTLSGGEKKKVAIAALLVNDPAVLLLDEPFAGLDPRTQVWLIELLQALRTRGKTIIAATHDLSFVTEIAERAIVLAEDHTLARDGNAPAILGDRALLLRVNLIHEHAHRHGSLVHVHPHAHGAEPGHEHGEGSP